MANKHWFDLLSVGLIRDVPRRVVLPTLAAVIANVAITAPAVDAARPRKGRNGKGNKSNNTNKRKRKRNRAQCEGETCFRGGRDTICCDAGLRCCSGQCVDVFDDNHCGACNNACSPGKICFGGKCECRPGLTECDGICRDTQRDENFCGGCDLPPCTGEGVQCCGGSCIDTRHSDSHCGRCNNPCTGDTDRCCDGTCFDSGFDSNHCGFFCLDCADGFECCHGRCINSATAVCCRDHTLDGPAACGLPLVCCTNADGEQDCC